MNETIKLIYLDRDNIKNVIVFFGEDNYNDNNINNTGDNANNSLFKEVFSKHQVDMIISQELKVHFSKQMIYIDDTIETIKKKIITVFVDELSTPISFDEIYLFSKQIQTLNNAQIYDGLTQNGKVSLTNDIMGHFLSNVNNVNLDQFQSKSIYTYNDIIDLNLADKPQIVNISVGQRFIIGEDKYSFTINPFQAGTFDKILEKNVDNIITTTNKELLLSSGFLFENTLYLCLTEDVLKYAISKNLSETTITKIYYPFLREKQIFDLKELKEKKYELLEENNTLINTNFIKYVENIDMFHQVYNTKKTQLNYIENGIQKIEFILSQDVEFNMPLETIFKLIHSTKTVPFIKLNSSKRQENIYRIYCDKIAKNGRKIPYLSKNVIFKLAKTMGMSKRVSCYLEINENKQTIPIINTT